MFSVLGEHDISGKKYQNNNSLLKNYRTESKSEDD